LQRLTVAKEPSVSASKLQSVLELPPAERVRALVELAGAAAAATPELLDAMVAQIEGGAGASRDRLLLGEALGRLGDPRLRAPADDDYWVPIQHEDGPFHLG